MYNYTALVQDFDIANMNKKPIKQISNIKSRTIQFLTKDCDIFKIRVLEIPFGLD